MSIVSRSISAFFTAAPGAVYLCLFLLTKEMFGGEYWWGTYRGLLIFLVLTCLLFGFTLPSLFQKIRLDYPWLWILVLGGLTWLLTLIVLGVLNLTPLCVWQDNGDGVDNIFACMEQAGLSALVYTPTYMGMLTVSALIGHGALKRQMRSKAQP